MLGHVRFENVVLYLDDVYLVTKTLDENLMLLELVLKFFNENELRFFIFKENV